MQIGDKVRDRVNSFTGIAVGMTEYINGCRQFLVKPQNLDEDGKQVDSMWIDEQHLARVSPQILKNPFAPPSQAPSVGGPDRIERAR